MEATKNDSQSKKELEFADEESFDEATNLQHLREVFEIKDDNEEDHDILSEELDDNDSVEIHSDVDDPVAYDPNHWTWETTLEGRWMLCQSLMQELRTLMIESNKQVKKALIIARKDLKQAKNRAAIRIYESKSVIGGTMVGYISRLKSIRATRPFAIVIEEASEVLEPLLLCCLSESTVKLKMIGDHLQLQPSVMSRNDFQICNKANVSMFQRLIEAPPGHTIPSTVLAVQRRMQANISNLTKRFDKDIVEIEDHESCHTKVIGQRNPGIPNATIRSSATGGREIPGVGPHVFLWTHQGAQKSPWSGFQKLIKTKPQWLVRWHLIWFNVKFPDRVLPS